MFGIYCSQQATGNSHRQYDTDYQFITVVTPVHMEGGRLGQQHLFPQQPYDPASQQCVPRQDTAVCVLRQESRNLPRETTEWPRRACTPMPCPSHGRFPLGDAVSQEASPWPCVFTPRIGYAWGCPKGRTQWDHEPHHHSSSPPSVRQRSLCSLCP